MPETAYIICLNDSTKAVVLDDEKKANKEMKRMKKQFKKMNDLRAEESFDHFHFWHLHTVPVL